jgi:hypothetical protein
MKYEELYKRVLQEWEWDYCECIARFLEWCEENDIEIKELGKNEVTDDSDLP